MEKQLTFLECVKEQRSSFAKIAATYTVSEHLDLRTEIDSLLIIYDQMAERLGALANKESASDKPEHETLGSVINWVACNESLPKHGQHVVTYTPRTEITEEQYRLIKYGSLKSGFPAGVTHWKENKPPCL